jgi:hypothetical protein
MVQTKVGQPLSAAPRHARAVFTESILYRWFRGGQGSNGGIEDYGICRTKPSPPKTL